MAVDLTPRFRRMNSQTGGFGQNAPPGFSGPFRATQLWQDIIRALQTQVEVRRRRRHLRVHAGCFAGADAVDSVLSHLMQSVVFRSSEVSRLKAARLCQALMDAKVFEPVGTKLFRRDKEAAFEDASSSLYRFVDCDALPGSATGGAGGSGDTENVVPGELERRKNKRVSRLNELRTISNPLAVGPSDRRVERLLKTINLHPSLPPRLNSASSSSSSTFISKAVVDAVWRQQTLLQLLQIVELPVLDCILTSPARAQACGGPLGSIHPDLVISNTCLDRELPQSLSLPQLDGWLSAAADCLELFPDQLIVVAGEQLRQQGGGTTTAASEGGQEVTCRHKRLLFDTMAKHYGGQEKSPLLSGRYLDVHVAILDLLDAEKIGEAIRASQLCLRLLDASTRDELRRLLVFMATAAHPEACRLQKQMDNRALVIRTFQKAIVQNNELTRAQGETLAIFLMDNHTQLFKTPTCLIEAVRKTLQTMQQGGDRDSFATFTFCQQVTAQQYEDQREATTLENLKQLLCDITQNDSMPVKEKKRLVKEFQKHHPVVFLQHFSSTF